MANKRKRNKATLARMKQAFKLNNDDGEGRKRNDHDSSHHKMKDKTLKTTDEATAQKRFRWVDERQVPPMKNSKVWYGKYLGGTEGIRKKTDFKIQYGKFKLDWETLAEQAGDKPPILDYTGIDYDYPEIIPIPPRGDAGEGNGGPYPPLEPMETLFEKWPQDNIDSPPEPFEEKLQHFNFNNPVHMEAAARYRDLEFPFKVYNIPEIDEAGDKWTDEYLSYHFDRFTGSVRGKYGVKAAEEKFGSNPPSSGRAQYSVDSFFAFFVGRNWNANKMGPPPTKDTDMTFAKWAKHARYADAVGLATNQVHYYYQAGVPAVEKETPKSTWTMIGADLPSFSVTKPNFFSFHPEEQKGIQCRFGERGVTAATHYDGGRNMVAMITGAKRYILSPPTECSKLGIVDKRKHPSFRHSMLNFGHISHLDKTDDEVADMPEIEREWLNRSKTALAVDTVLKAGEVLYIPSNWFHYIVSLQKSAQCNVRSGKNFKGSPEFGGVRDVETCVDNND